MITAADVKRHAADLGFVACGITDLADNPHGAELDAWLAAGYGGTMRYLHRQARRRREPRLIVAEARSAVVVLDNYYYDVPQEPPLVAKYSRGSDYHVTTLNRLNALAEFLTDCGAQVARPFVDAGPVPERELAQRAGLGWIGKNTMLIRPGLGSYTFIGTILTDLELDRDHPFEADRCGSCTRCLDACPTEAFVAPRVLDATKCISYLTIEHKGPIPEELADRFEGWAFGCDICNDVCPWNVRFATESTVPEFRPRQDLADAGETYFEDLTEEEFARRFGDTPFERPGLAGMRRNWRAAAK